LLIFNKFFILLGSLTRAILHMLDKLLL